MPASTGAWTPTACILCERLTFSSISGYTRPRRVARGPRFGRASTSIGWKCIKRDEVDPAQSLVWEPGRHDPLQTPALGTATTSGSF